MITKIKFLFTLAVIGGALIAIPPLTARMDKDVRRRNTGHAISSKSPIVLLLNSLQSSISDTIFMKTEVYLHEGVNYYSSDEEEHHHGHGGIQPDHGAKLIDKMTSDSAVHQANTHTTETKTSASTREHTDSNDLLAHEDVEHMHTSIPKKEDDFRGFLGDLERKVKPWRPEHIDDHGKGIELVPWYRTATLVDPHNIRCYIMGAWWLSSNHMNDEAIRFIKEGIQNNPDDFQLRVMLGELYIKVDRKKEAFDEFTKGFTLGLKLRPQDGKVSPNWTVYQESDMIEAANFRVILTRDLETTAAAIRCGNAMMRQVHEMPSIERIVNTIKQ